MNPPLVLNALLPKIGIQTILAENGQEALDVMVCGSHVIEADDLGPLTIESLRSLLYKVVGEEVTEDLLDQLLAEESETANVIEGVRRSVITKMGLRDQRRIQV